VTQTTSKRFVEQTAVGRMKGAARSTVPGRRFTIEAT
jgi:hypothetical protein